MKISYEIIFAELKTRDHCGHLCIDGKIQTSDKVHEDVDCVRVTLDRAQLL